LVSRVRFKEPVDTIMASASRNVLQTLPILNDKNYNQWFVRMKAIIGYQEIFEIVKEGISIAEKDVSAAKNKDYKGMCLLHQCVELRIFEKISKTKTSNEAWEIPKKA